MAAISDYDLGWLVGILEGEGYFGLSGGNSKYKTEKLEVKMCDEDIVLKVAALFEQIANVSVNVRMKIDKQHPDWSPQYHVYIGGEAARIVMRLIVKRMGIRRRKKIYQTLNRYTAPKAKLPKDFVDNVIAIHKLRTAT